MEEAARLWVGYMMADAATKEAAWAAFVNFLVRNPAVYEGIMTGAGAFSEAAVAQIFAGVQRALIARGAIALAEKMVTERIAFRLFLTRLAGNFAISPKVPVPQAQLAICLMVVIGTTGQAFAEGSSKKAALPKYNDYLTNYFVYLLKIGAIHPQQLPRIVPPKDFEEWYAEQ